ncbi:MAG: energy transducer TonB [Pyrinomonadaceae bacterium]
MLEKLVESKNTGKDSRLFRTLLLSAGSLVSGAFVLGLILSIFGTNLAMSGEGLDLTRLVSPTMIPEEKPAPEPEPEREQPKSQPVRAVATVKETVRKVNQQRIDEIPVRTPKNVSTSKNVYRSRPVGNFKLGNEEIDRTPPANAPTGPQRAGNNPGAGFGNKPVEVEKPKVETKEVAKKVPAPPPMMKEKPKKDIIITKGVINGEAKYLAMPTYTSAMKSMNFRGKISVSILIDETGRIISATPQAANPLFAKAVTDAARRSKFAPTTLSGNPVKVRGIIIYNFN